VPDGSVQRHGLQHQHCEGRLVVRVIGEIDLANSFELRSALEAASRDADVVEVDLGEATFFDATGLTALVYGRRAAVAQGGSLVLTRVPSFLRRMLDITGLESMLAASPEHLCRTEP
jgi:anti-anti-sigma factor